MKNKTTRRGLILSLLFCMTLGLAPFGEEPHLIGKLKWIQGGAVDLEFMDWVDFVMHGLPFLILMFFVYRLIFGTSEPTVKE